MDSPATNGGSAASTPASAVQFLTFDEQRKLCYGGYCKLGIHGAGKCLTIEPFGEDCKPLSAFFKWKFIRQKNLLHIFSDSKLDDLILVFANESVCEKLLLGISKYYPHISATDQLYQHELLIPFFYQLYNFDILKIAKSLIQSFNYKEKEKLINFIKANDLYDTVYSCLLPDDDANMDSEICQNQQPISSSSSNSITPPIQIQQPQQHPRLQIQLLSQNYEPLSEITENSNNNNINSIMNNNNGHHQKTPLQKHQRRQKRPSRSMTSPIKRRVTSSSLSSRGRGRGRPKKDDDEEVEDNKLIHKRLYARAYREQHQKTVKEYQQCSLDFYNALVANGIDVKQQFPEHAKLIQKLTEKTPGRS